MPEPNQSQQSTKNQNFTPPVLLEELTNLHARLEIFAAATKDPGTIADVDLIRRTIVAIKSLEKVDRLRLVEKKTAQLWRAYDRMAAVVFPIGHPARGNAAVLGVDSIVGQLNGLARDLADGTMLSRSNERQADADAVVHAIAMLTSGGAR